MTRLTPDPRPPRRSDAAAPKPAAPRAPSRLTDDTVFAFVAFVLGAGLLVWRWHVADVRGLPTPNGQLAWGGGLIALAAYFIASGKVRGAVGMVRDFTPGVFGRWAADRRGTGAPPPGTAQVTVAEGPSAPAGADALGAALLARLVNDPDAIGRALRDPTGDTVRVSADERRALVEAADVIRAQRARGAGEGA